MPNSIEAAILLHKTKPGAYVVVSALMDIIKKFKKGDFYNSARQKKIVDDLLILISSKGYFPPHALAFPVGSKVNIAKNHYLSTSPLLGLIAEYLAFGKQPFHLKLVKVFINLHFIIVDNNLKYTDKDYANWLSGNEPNILGIYKSSLERAARAIRENIRLNSRLESEGLIDLYNGIGDVGVTENTRPLILLKMYSEGKLPKSKASKAQQAKSAKRTSVGQVESISVGHFADDSDDVEIEQKVIEVEFPSYPTSQQDFLNKYNKISGRANQLNRQNQLRAVAIEYMRPSIWGLIDGFILSQSIDSEVRALVCLSLLSGRSFDNCHTNYGKMLRTVGFISMSINTPDVSASKHCLHVNNTLKIPIAHRYLQVFSGISSLSSSALSNARKAIKELDKDLDITPEKISRLFFSIANSIGNKSYAAMMFDSPLQTIMTQLHYTVVAKNNLIDLYQRTFLGFEEVLPMHMGIQSSSSSDICGVSNFPDPYVFKESLNELNKSALYGDSLNCIRGFIIYSSGNGSRSVINQAADLCSRLDQKCNLAVINDKRRRGAQYARVSFLKRKTLSHVYDLIDSPVRHPQNIFFEYSDYSNKQNTKNIYSSIQLKPVHFSSKYCIDFKMNAIRKMRRSFLLNMGVSEEIIDALNGHHYVGTVPISPQSTLSINSIYESAIQYIELFELLVERMIDE